jgi:aerobic carbon-monoxide dehydrogenase large subunit
MSAERAPRWVGKPLPRREDPALLTGSARYIADLATPNTLRVGFVRSTVAHADIVSIDTVDAASMPGIEAVFTAADFPDLRPQPSTHRLGTRPTPYHALAGDRVRHVGEAVAVIVGVSEAAVADAAEAVIVDYHELAVVTDVTAALHEESPRIYEDWPDNVAGTFDIEMGDIDAAIGSADVVVRARISIGRQSGASIEPRGVLAEWDRHGERLVFWTSTQSPNIVRDFISDITGIPEHKVQVRVPAVGGGFGTKFHFYCEESMVALLAPRFDRPLLWLEGRTESFVASVHSRQQTIDATIAGNHDGTIVGISAEILADMGAYMHMVSYGPAWLTSVMMTNAYLIPNARVRLNAVVTNKVPSGSYRGWGQPQANFVVERMVDLLATKLQLDRAEIRRRNFVPPERFPYKSLFHTFDSGRYAECLDRGLELGRHDEWLTYQAEARANGRHVGIGLSFYVENTALGPSCKMNQGGLEQGGYDISNIRVEPGGEITIFTGLCEMGQGFTNGLAQLCADAVGVHPDQIEVITGDTDACPYTGHGTGASRSAAIGGAAVLKASATLRAKIEAIAAHMLEAAPEDLVIEDGTISVTGSPDRSITMADIGRAAYLRAIDLPPGMAPGLEAIEVYDPPDQAWPYGLNHVVVEVDVDTGLVTVLDYAVMHDCGTILNPMIVDGQIHGGVAQGIAAALHEEIVYDDDGQILTTSFMDYRIPSAVELPNFRLGHMTTPSPVIPGGMKGTGEAGVIGPPAAIVGAIEDALGPAGPTFTSMPISPAMIIAALRNRPREVARQ